MQLLHDYVLCAVLRIEMSMQPGFELPAPFTSGLLSSRKSQKTADAKSALSVGRGRIRFCLRSHKSGGLDGATR
jgi:hypothetical protein